jgi:hypothetical protein
MRTLFAILFFPLYVLAIVIGLILRPVVFGIMDGIYLFEIMDNRKYMKQAEKILEKSLENPVDE